MGGDVILTTRDWISTANATVIHIDKMNSTDALQLLLGSGDISLSANSLQSQSARLHDAEKIIAELDCMPLAIDMARAYIEDTGISLQKYLSMFDSKHNDLLAYHADDDAKRYDYTVATVWQLSFDKMRQQDPTAAKILDVCAFLQPDAIPEILFERQFEALSLLRNRRKQRSCHGGSPSRDRHAAQVFVFDPRKN